MEKWVIFFAEFNMAEEDLFTDTQLFLNREEAEVEMDSKKAYYTEIAKSPYKDQGLQHGRNFDVKVTEETTIDSNPVRTVHIQRITDLLEEHYQATMRLEKLV